MNINININKEIDIDKKTIIIVIAIVCVLFLGFILSSCTKEDGEISNNVVHSVSDNIMLFSKDNNSGMKDLKLTGYFSDNILEKYIISYYIEYGNAENARDDYERMKNGIEERKDVKYSYTVNETFLYTTIEYIVSEMDKSILKSNFGVDDAELISRNKFSNYAQKQGYILAQ